MTTRIYPMPKIRFEGSDHNQKAYMQNYCFYSCYGKNGTNYVLIERLGQHNGERELIDFTLFKDVVLEWVKNWVIDNFDGIILPEKRGYEGHADNTYALCTITGYNSYGSKLLELNPNCIRSEQ